jgi:SM-20-related protein
MQHDASGARPGLPLSGEPGLLVAFDSAMVHGVTPVTRGERYTIVTWFTARPAED